MSHLQNCKLVAASYSWLSQLMVSVTTNYFSLYAKHRCLLKELKSKAVPLSEPSCSWGHVFHGCSVLMFNQIIHLKSLLM